MREISEIKADIAKSNNNQYWTKYYQWELIKAIISDIPLDRLEWLCEAEKKIDSDKFAVTECGDIEFYSYKDYVPTPMSRNCVGIPLEDFTAYERWKTAYKDGRCVVLPCKVGDTLYRPELAPTIPLKEMICAGFEVVGGAVKVICKESDIEIPLVFTLGKTVFLTREAAEAAKEATI